jgi:uncharacterized protein CbrC (UPF0167 family)
MIYRLYMEPNGSISTLTIADAKMGDGSSVDDFEKSFDGSTPVIDFEIPDDMLHPVTRPPDEFGITHWDTQRVSWELAKIIQNVAREVAWEAQERQSKSKY